jgi:hypothetical protein
LPIEIRRYVRREGRDVFGRWLDALADTRARAKILVRIDRVAAGNLGDVKSLGKALHELRIDWGPLPSLLGLDCKSLRATARRWRQAKTERRHQNSIGAT